MFSLLLLSCVSLWTTAIVIMDFVKTSSSQAISATKIVAFWRGYVLRKKMRIARYKTEIDSFVTSVSKNGVGHQWSFFFVRSDTKIPGHPFHNGSSLSVLYKGVVLDFEYAKIMNGCIICLSFLDSHHRDLCDAFYREFVRNGAKKLSEKSGEVIVTNVHDASLFSTHKMLSDETENELKLVKLVKMLFTNTIKNDALNLILEIVKHIDDYSIEFSHYLRQTIVGKITGVFDTALKHEDTEQNLVACCLYALSRVSSVPDRQKIMDKYITKVTEILENNDELHPAFLHPAVLRMGTYITK